MGRLAILPEFQPGLPLGNCQSWEQSWVGKLFLYYEVTRWRDVADAPVACQRGGRLVRLVARRPADLA